MNIILLWFNESTRPSLPFNILSSHLKWLMIERAILPFASLVFLVSSFPRQTYSTFRTATEPFDLLFWWYVWERKGSQRIPSFHIFYSPVWFHHFIILFTLSPSLHSHLFLLSLLIISLSFSWISFFSRLHFSAEHTASSSHLAISSVIIISVLIALHCIKCHFQFYFFKIASLLLNRNNEEIASHTTHIL